MSHKHLAIVAINVFNLVIVLSASALGSSTYYVATDGLDSNDGSIGSPFATFTHAIDVVGFGDTIYARGGTYDISSRISISKSGASGSPINLYAYPGETPILDFSSMTAVWGSSSGRGVQFNTGADWWHVKGLTIQNTRDNGLYNGANNSVFEQIVTRYNGDSGLQLHDTASHNLVLNCDSYENYDWYTVDDETGDPKPGENADGFAAKSSNLGPGNIYRGNRSWGNSDDGWDTYYTTVNGVMVQDCWSFDNGFNTWGVSGFAGDGTGYKLGDPGGPHVLTNNLAVDNAHNGVDINGNTTAVQVYNTTSYSNSGKNWMFDEYISTQILKNNISWRGGSSDTIRAQVDDTYNSWNPGVSLSDADFQSITRSPGGVDLLKQPRQADGSLPDLGGFLHLVSGSDLIDHGTPISFTFDGVTYNLPYNDAAPDIGAFETGIAPPELPGDYNGDDVVDAADYTVWRDNLNTSTTLPNDETPGSVTEEDYTVWRNHFGESLGSGSMAGGTAVPEPAGIVLAFGAIAILLARRPR
jgi:hypothetical protein